MKRFALLAVLLFTAQSGFGQDVDPYTVLRTHDGVVVVWNEEVASSLSISQVFIDAKVVQEKIRKARK